VGCQRGDSSQAPAAAVNAASEEKTEAVPDSSPAPPKKPDQDDGHPVVQFETSMGRFTVKLDATKARATVDNFLKYVASGHYDQTIFHQVLSQYPKVIIGGAFTPQLVEKKRGFTVRNEADNGLKNRRGTIGMARLADLIDSSTCDFYINLADNEALDHKDETPQGYGYCVFGEVVDGLEVLDKIGQAALCDKEDFPRIPVDTVVITSARRVR
jgi:cyclophilin family peptidyl-prolyl cis-trans isomerase